MGFKVLLFDLELGSTGMRSVLLPVAPFVAIATFMAFSYNDFKLVAICTKGINCRQQVFTAHEPETPWHLHLVFNPSLTI